MYRMPAEWEPHEATWIAWPHNREDWPGRFMPIPWVYGEIVRKLSRVEKVRILVDDRALAEQARRVLRKVGADMDALEFYLCPTNRVWTRDYGPLFVKNGSGEVALTAWKFNAWAKYDDWRHDAEVPAYIAQAFEASRPQNRYGAGGRQHRCEWRGPPAEHGRVSAQFGAGAQSGTEAPRRSSAACATILEWSA